jgi:1,4-alpha-glucan branching enzyme
MPGDDWQKLATLRLLLAYQWAQPGKKLLFMGCEFGQWREWNHDDSLDWHLLDETVHAGIRHLVGDLNRVLRDHPALHELDFDGAGFRWVEANDAANGVLAFERRAADGERVLAVFGLTPVPRANYRIGVERPGRWVEILNTDSRDYGGSGWGSLGAVQTDPVPYHGHPHSLVLTLPALGAVLLKPVPDGGAA